MEIHPSAVVSPKAELAEGVKIGPYSSIGDHVKIGRDTTIGAHVVIEGHTEIGERNKIYPFSSIGTPPQDIGYRGEDTRLIIGNDNIIREYVTINRATTKEQWQTVIGNHNYIMAYAHIAHDCVLGDWVIMSNVATLGGHITIGDHAILGGLVAVHQFVRIGAYAFLGAKSGIDRDVPPFMMTAGPRARLYGINRKGLARMGFSQEAIDGLKRAYRIIWRENRRFSEGIAQVKRELTPFPELEILLNFFNGSKRGILR
ncbi:MAG: acyl-ACP--UDP-N-acetylglucosamine O-acyltransferase [Deltaproteobacteria bacterium]|nr:acyl-ACP--UDP-N-acetylglucosamine O-acyltransferase [Deltaproteobacteria bacterium]MBW1929057.1 acyl-ACP--UDP-N-acetylglucosamine O-acyltransferase [Deltaproteobacteria bacterium]MBW2024590.1 acyl-ACP--UDP-N-acetylglucosamine O-acyltransferase [Deltaproteobacteria bacterium]MBW2125389.1 acyl-ACP--UDP-N-acetylglucosamine O-acyltransferase [Deltaproteobacteria bacterium]RLB16437.1 MAG: acyl-[acyl-carrier-protein]--UDP-N-acetylglucosamine O-acyltransferase [Deltaproteobacteria bacterium]